MTNFKRKRPGNYVNEKDGVIYINKELVVYVQDRIRLFYIAIGHIVFKLSSVLLLYIGAISFLTTYNTNISDVLENATAVITSALPSLIRTQLKLELPHKSIITYIIFSYIKISVRSSDSKITDTPSNTDNTSTSSTNIFPNDQDINRLNIDQNIDSQTEIKHQISNTISTEFKMSDLQISQTVENVSHTLNDSI